MQFIQRALAEALIMRYEGRLAEHRRFIDEHVMDSPDISGGKCRSLKTKVEISVQFHKKPRSAQDKIEHSLFRLTSRVIPRRWAWMQDKLSLESLFQDTLSWIYSTALAATLEKIQIVPSI